MRKILRIILGVFLASFIIVFIASILFAAGTIIPWLFILGGIGFILTLGLLVYYAIVAWDKEG